MTTKLPASRVNRTNTSNDAITLNSRLFITKAFGCSNSVGSDNSHMEIGNERTKPAKPILKRLKCVFEGSDEKFIPKIPSIEDTEENTNNTLMHKNKLEASLLSVTLINSPGQTH